MHTRVQARNHASTQTRMQPRMHAHWCTHADTSMVGPGNAHAARAVGFERVEEAADGLAAVNHVLDDENVFPAQRLEVVTANDLHVARRRHVFVAFEAAHTEG